jgi:hypothetical protein
MDLNNALSLRKQAFDEAAEAQEWAATAAQAVAAALDKLARWDAAVSEGAKALTEAVKRLEADD